MDMTRRSFVHSAAAAGTGLAVSGKAFAQAAGAADKDLVNVGIIGTGTQGRVLLGDCTKIPGVRFRAICDIWEFSQRYSSRRLMAQYKNAGKADWASELHVYKDYEEMLDKEKELDAVIVATPDFVHAKHAIACMDAGKHVYCEKEMSNTLENARKMVEASARTKRLLQIGHQRRSNPVYRYAFKLINETGVCGRLTHCYGQWNRGVQPKLEWPSRYEMPAEDLKKYGYDSMEHFRNWRWYRKYSAGPIADLGSHQIDIFSWFLHGDPDKVVALGGADYFKDREWYEDVLAMYEYASEHKGQKGSARAFYQVLNTNSYGHYFERFSGDGGALTISENPKKCYYVSEPGKEIPDWMASVEAVLQGGHQAVPLLPAIAKMDDAAAVAMAEIQEKNVHQLHLENFIEAVRANDKSKLTCDGEEAYKTAVAVLNVIPAIEAGGGVSFKPEDFTA